MEMKRMDTVANEIRQGKQTNRKTEAEITQVMKNIAMDKVHLQFEEDAGNKQRLQRKIDEAEATLAELLGKAQTVRNKVRLHEHALRQNYPELLVESASVVPGESALWRSKLVDESLKYHHYHPQESLVVDKVMVMRDPYGQQCVLKKLIGSKQVRREAERLYKLEHPLVMRITRLILDASYPDSICYRQMPFYEHGNLRQWVQRMQAMMESYGYLPEHAEFVEVQNTFRQLTQALAHVHAKGVVHRDFKPENVLVAQGGRVALCDFGISSDIGTDGGGLITTTVTGVAGTPGYLAPEMLTGTKEWRKFASAVDMWAWGCMLLELFLPVFPRVFGYGASLHSMELHQIKWPELIASFERTPHMQQLVRLCSHLLRKDPAERLTAHDVLLEPVLCATTASERFDPVAQLNLVLRPLVSNRKTNVKAVVLTLPCSRAEAIGDGPTDASIDEEIAGEIVCQTMLAKFENALPDLHVPVQFRDAYGDQVTFSEVMDVFFRHIVLPKYGLFTQSVAVDPTRDEGEMTRPDRAYLPSIKGDKKHLQVVGMLLAKCLLEGIRVPFVLNSCCLEWLLGRTSVSAFTSMGRVPMTVDECLSCLSETDESEVTSYRTILLTRQYDNAEYPMEIGVLLGSTSEQNVTDGNKHRVVSEAIWPKLVGCRVESLTTLCDGFKKLSVYENLRAISGKELQLLFYGNDFVEVDIVKQSVSFQDEAWLNGTKLASIKTWFTN